MKASELIAMLAEAITEHGDLVVCTPSGRPESDREVDTVEFCPPTYYYSSDLDQKYGSTIRIDA